MTPKEKANELGNKFYQGSVFDYDKQGHLDEIIKAKNRALIAVDFAKENPLNTEGYNKYLDEVKQEILNL